MTTRAPALSPIFRSDSQAEILARIILNPDRSHTTAELARLTDTAYATAYREVQRLVSAQLVREEKVGRAIRLTADTSSPMYQPLAELLRLSYGPAVVVPRCLARVSGIEEAYIYGSWAARRAAEKGDAPGDIDVLVVGNPSRSAVADAAAEAERTLGREVNIRIVSPTAWKDSADLFIKTVQQRPLLRIHRDGDPA